MSLKFQLFFKFLFNTFFYTDCINYAFDKIIEAIYRRLFVWVIYLLQMALNLCLKCLYSLCRISKSLFIKFCKLLNGFIKNCYEKFKYIKYLYLLLSKFLYYFLKSDLDEKGLLLF